MTLGAANHLRTITLIDIALIDVPAGV